MTNNLFDKKIEEIGMDKTIYQKLKNNNILLLKDLWKLNRKDLKSYNLNDSEVNQIIIKMQLMSLDLNKKIYNKK